MLLKDCPVGSVVRLVGVGGSNEIPRCWRDLVAVVQEDDEGNFVIDRDKDKRHCKNNFHHFEIVRPAPEATPEPRITFTVGGKEFYVGQRVWRKVNGGRFPAGDEIEVIGKYGDDYVTGRKPGTFVTCVVGPKNLLLAPPTPHEWRRGDWARHEDGRECFVCGAARPHGAYGPVSLMVSFEGEAITNIPASEFTFIKHIDLPS